MSRIKVEVRPVRATCSRCRKHRRIAARDEVGPLCAACAGPNPAWHHCPECGTRLLGRGNGLCAACCARHRADRRIALDVELFEQPWVRALFLDFCASGSVRKEAGNIVARIDRYAGMFLTIQTRFRTSQEITQAGLFDAFGSEGLRRAFKVISFICKTLEIPWSMRLLEDLNERRRIEDILDRAPVSWRASLERFRDHHQGRGIKLLTTRYYLTAAMEFVETAAVAQPGELTSAHVTRFIRRRRGQAASLGLFLTWLGKTEGVVLKRPHVRCGDPARHEKAIVASLGKIIPAIDRTHEPRRRAALAAAAVTALYQVPLSRVLALEGTAVIEQNGHVALEPDLNSGLKIVQ